MLTGELMQTVWRLFKSRMGSYFTADRPATTQPLRYNPECAEPVQKAAHSTVLLVSHSGKANSGTEKMSSCGWSCRNTKGESGAGWGDGLFWIPAVAVPTHIYASSRIHNRPVHQRAFSLLT